MGTFHGICLELLKKNGRQVRIVPEEERKGDRREICREYGLDLPAKEFLREVSLWKTGDGAGGFQKETENSTVSSEALESYQKKMGDRAGYDFDDLLLEVLELFEKGEITEGGKCFRYLLVDEFRISVLCSTDL